MADISSNLELLYAFDESSGTTATDTSGNGVDATLHGSAAFATGQINNALDIVNSSAYATSPFGGTFTDLTLSLWFYCRGTNGTYDRFIDADYFNGFWFGINGANTAQFGGAFKTGGAGALGAFSTLSTNTWTHAVITRVSSTGVNTLYVNGTLVTTYNGASGATNIAPFRLGQDLGGGEPANVILDDVRIYSRTLTAGDVTALFAYPTSPSMSGFARLLLLEALFQQS